METIYVFSPHPDDETFACGGIIAKRILEGFEVKIVFMTDGSKSHTSSFNIHSDPSPKELVAIRMQEAMNAATILGVKLKNLFFLDVEDGKLASAKDVVTKKVIDLLGCNINAIPQIFLPHKRDYHNDHIATNSIVLKAIDALKVNTIKYFYKVYPMDGQTKENELGIKREIDIADVLSIKTKAICQYKSQIEIFSAKQLRPVISSAFLNRFYTNSIETFWQ